MVLSWCSVLCDSGSCYPLLSGSSSAYGEDGSLLLRFSPLHPYSASQQGIPMRKRVMWPRMMSVRVNWQWGLCEWDLAVPSQFMHELPPQVVSRWLRVQSRMKCFLSSHWAVRYALPDLRDLCCESGFPEFNPGMGLPQKNVEYDSFVIELSTKLGLHSSSLGSRSGRFLPGMNSWVCGF